MGSVLTGVIAIARRAGAAILEVYQDGCPVETKADGSPVTDADHRAQEIICAGLAGLAPGIPVVAEEAPSVLGGSGAAGSGSPQSFWLVDPLDGTKEFLSRNGEFTVNIALIEEGVPVLGVVLAPALGRLFACSEERGAVLEDGTGQRSISARTVPAEGATVVSSRSHGDPEALERCLAGRRIAASILAGSSLKFCLVAAGEADLYPRFGTTMEWDTAAGDAILRSAGGTVTDLEGRPLVYGKPGFENPQFIAAGRGAEVPARR